MGSFEGAFASAKTFSLTQVKFQFNKEQKFKYCMTLKRIKMLKQKGYKQCQKPGTQKQKLFGTFFLPFCFSIFQDSVIVQVLLREREVLARATAPLNDPIIERVPILAPVCHSF